MKKNKGFTLIELLVVIAIIGILASIVLASLSNARDKGKDASVKSQLSSMRAQAELYFTEKGYYYKSPTDNVCVAKLADNGFGGSEVDENGVPKAPVSGLVTPGPGLIFATQEASAISLPEVFVGVDAVGTDAEFAGAWNQITCHVREADPDNSIAEAWAVDAPMSNSLEATAKMYCVDSLGTSKEKDGALALGAYNCE